MSKTQKTALIISYIYQKKGRVTMCLKKVVICFISFLIISVQTQGQNKNTYPIDTSKDQLTLEDIDMIFSFLDVSIYRYSYSMPFDHSIQLIVEYYEDGKKIKEENGGSTCVLERDKQQNFLILSQRKKAHVKVSLQTEKCSTGLGVSFMENKKVLGQVSFDKIFFSAKEKTPLFAIISNNSGKLSMEYAKKDIQKMIPHYDWVAVIYGKIKKS